MATAYGTQNPGIHPSVQEATAAALPAYSYSAGVITASSNGALTVDGVAVAANDRVLVRNETSTNAPYNGIYVATSPGGASAPFVLTRAPDMATGPQVPGSLVLVEQGTVNAGLLFQVASAGPFTLGVTNITWAQFTGSGVGSVTAADASIVVGGTGTAPTVATGTLDQVANLHPPAANWSNNSKKITSLANGTAAADAAAFGQIPQSLQFLTGGGTITATTITTAQSAGFQGIFLDPRYVWDASGLVIKDISNFIIESRMVGSIGYNAAISYNATGYVKTGTGSPADGIQVYSDGTTETQGIIFRGLALVGANGNAVVHYGGRQRRCGMESCFAYNTSSAATTVTGGAGTAVSSFTGTQSLTVASTTGFPSSGTLIVATTNGLALLTYTGTTGTTFTNCTLVGGVGNLSTTSGTNQVSLLAAAVIDDTGLAGFNSEDQFFAHCAFAATAGAAIGIDIANIAQHANDALWDDVATASASGVASLVAMGGGGHNFVNYYDRSSPAIATVWNHGAGLNFWGGEDQNGHSSSQGVSHLLTSSNSATVCISRNLTQATGGFATTASLIAGTLAFRGRCKANNGGVAIGGTSVLDISDPATVFSAAAITGSSGTLALAASYTSGAGPTVSGWTGTTTYPAVPAITAADTSVVVGGTPAAPTVRTGTLDVIAAQHPPAASVAMNNQKVTSLANGTAATDGAAFGQIPTSAGSIGGLLAANNLSDVANAATARGNLGAAQDSAVVHLAGTETITGAKTFSVPPNLATQSVNATATLAAASAPVVLTDTTTAAFTLTLPAAPTTGEFFIIVDDTGQWATHNLTIGRNAKNIDGAAANLTIANQWGKVWLYYDGTAWWSIAHGLSNETPVALGVAGPGVHNSAARIDHAHPTTGLVTSVTAADGSVVVGGTSAAPTLATGTLDVIATDHPPAAAVPMNGKTLTNAGAQAVTLPWMAGVFGDASDGAVNFDGTSTVLGLVPAAGVYTLTRDIFCTSLQVGGGGTATTIITAGWRIFAQGTVTIASNGTVSANGAAASGTNQGGAGGATGTGTIAGGRSGSSGQAGAQASTGTASSGVGTGAPGAGGNGTGGTGAASPGAPPSTGVSWFRTPGVVLAGVLFNTSTVQRIDGGGGGSGAGGDGTNKGGAGGSGGGVVVILAWAIVNNGTISAKGGNGGSPSTVVTNGGCGGGGAGAGGLVLLYTLSAVTGSGTISVAAGTAGTAVTNGSGTATNGGPGAAGSYLNVVLA